MPLSMLDNSPSNHDAGDGPPYVLLGLKQFELPPPMGQPRKSLVSRDTCDVPLTREGVH